MSSLASGPCGYCKATSEHPSGRESPSYDLIKTRIGPSVSLTVATEIIAVLVAIPLGVLAAWKANSLV